MQEIMLLFLASCNHVQIAGQQGISRSTVRRTLAEAGSILQEIVSGTDAFRESARRGDLQVRIVPFGTEDDCDDFLRLGRETRTFSMSP